MHYIRFGKTVIYFCDFCNREIKEGRAYVFKKRGKTFLFHLSRKSSRIGKSRSCSNDYFDSKEISPDKRKVDVCGLESIAK